MSRMTKQHLPVLQDSNENANAKENENAIILCTGSLYFAAEILNLN